MAQARNDAKKSRVKTVDIRDMSRQRNPPEGSEGGARWRQLPDEGKCPEREARYAFAASTIESKRTRAEILSDSNGTS